MFMSYSREPLNMLLYFNYLLTHSPTLLGERDLEGVIDKNFEIGRLFWIICWAQWNLKGLYKWKKEAKEAE